MIRPRVLWRWNAYKHRLGFVLWRGVPRPTWRTIRASHAPANDVSRWGSR